MFIETSRSTKSLFFTVRSSFIEIGPVKLGVISPRPLIAEAGIEALGKETVPSTSNPLFTVNLSSTVKLLYIVISCE